MENIKELNLEVTDKTLSVVLFVTKPCDHFSLSSKFRIGRAVEFQVKILHMDDYDNDFICIHFKKINTNDELTYMITLNSTKMKIVNKSFYCDDTWYLVAENQKTKFTVDVNLEVTIVRAQPCTGPFASLHNDSVLTDFELRGTDGSVRVHRAAIATCSPVLRTMLEGAWKETAEGLVDVPETSQETLQHFKDYVYLHKLPENGCKQLLLVASCYMMNDLEMSCIHKLVESLTAKNTYDLLDFAMKNKMPKLLFAILECINRKVEVNDIREHHQQTVSNGSVDN